MSSVFDPLIIKMLRFAGHHERADAIARAASNEGGGQERGEPDHESDEHGAGGGGNVFAHHGGGPVPTVESDAASGGEHGTGGSGGASGTSHDSGAAEAGGGGHAGGGHDGGAVEGHEADSGSGHEGHGHDSGAQATPDTHHGPESHGTHVSEQAETHAHGIDPHDPLAGLHSDKLRGSLEREAFRGADADAQDSAIAITALSPGAATMQRLEAKGREPEKLDVSREAQAGRVAALKGELPLWARDNSAYDPALIRAREQSQDNAPSPALDRAQSRAIDTAPSQVRASSRDGGMER